MLEYPFDVDGPAALADEQGRFTLELFERQAYCVGAIVQLDNSYEQRHAKPIDLSSSGNVTGLELVIASPGGDGPSDRQSERIAHQQEENLRR